MSPQAVQEPEEDEAVSREDGDVEALLERIVRQNERIIRLLEGGEEDGRDAGIDGIL